MRRRFAIMVLFGCLLARAAPAATLSVETFGNPGIAGWVDRDASEMTVSYSASLGNPAGALQGTFAAQDVAGPETDAFRIDGGSSGGVFMGDYWTDVPGFNSWSFSFYADDVLPTDLLIRFGDGANTFLRSALSQVSAVDNWYTVTVPLTYAGWLGGSAADFSNALGGVSFIDLQLTRSGIGAQDFYVDNFALNGGLAGGSSVPEPSTAGLLFVSTILLRVVRRRSGHARQALSGIWPALEPRRRIGSSRQPGSASP
jgi:hypothetical protein